jgi:hypothetical protein
MDIFSISLIGSYSKEKTLLTEIIEKINFDSFPPSIAGSK